MRKLNMGNTRHIRRILAATLAIIMAMSLAVPAFALEYDTHIDPSCPYCNTGGSRVSIADAVAATVSFPDVAPGIAAYDAVMYCAAHGIINGYSDGTFRPVNTLSRSNFTVILSRAFFPDEVAEYTTPNYLANGQFYPNYVAMSQAGALRNTSFENFITNNMNVGISRYDMAQLVTNIMNKYGYAASSSEKNAVISGIPDYSEIPSEYKDAVLNVYSLGIIGGYTGGYFSGKNTVTRQVGAIVLYRMLAKCDMLEDDEQTTPNPETPIDPETGGVSCACVTVHGKLCEICHTVSDVTIPSKPADPVTPVDPVDPGETEQPETPVTPTGRTLANGKAITEANVTEILNQLKETYPRKTDFSKGYAGLGSGRAGAKNCIAQVTNQYGVDTAHDQHVSTTAGCGGWAAFVADEIFGQTGVTWRKTNIENARPGDLMITLDDSGYLMHVSIYVSEVTGFPKTTKVYTTDATTNSSGVYYITWNNNSRPYTNTVDVWTAYPN